MTNNQSRTVGRDKFLASEANLPFADEIQADGGNAQPDGGKSKIAEFGSDDQTPKALPIRMRRTMGNILRLAILLACLLPAHAEEATVFGHGLDSCAKWTEARGTRSYRQGLYTQWLAGFLSGLNIESKGPDVLNGQGFDALMAWLDNYCGTNPLEPIASAAFALMKELRTRNIKGQ